MLLTQEQRNSMAHELTLLINEMTTTDQLHARDKIEIQERLNYLEEARSKWEEIRALAYAIRYGTIKKIAHEYRAITQPLPHAIEIAMEGLLAVESDGSPACSNCGGSYLLASINQIWSRQESRWVPFDAYYVPKQAYCHDCGVVFKIKYTL